MRPVAVNLMTAYISCNAFAFADVYLTNEYMLAISSIHLVTLSKDLPLPCSRRSCTVTDEQ